GGSRLAGRAFLDLDLSLVRLLDPVVDGRQVFPDRVGDVLDRLLLGLTLGMATGQGGDRDGEPLLGSFEDDLVLHRCLPARDTSPERAVSLYRDPPPGPTPGVRGPDREDVGGGSAAVAQFAFGLRLGAPGSGGRPAVRSWLAACRTAGEGSALAISASRVR